MSFERLTQDVHCTPDTIEMIHDFQFDTAISGGKTKSRLECRHRKLGQKTKKGISCKLLIPLVYAWRPQRDLNSCRQRERAI